MDPMPKPIPVEYAVEITVHTSENGPRLLPNQEYNFLILNEREIHMVNPLLQGGQPMVILLKLDPKVGAIESLSFGRDEDEASKNLRTLDTQGEYYPMSPFIISPGMDGAAEITIVNEGDKNHFDDQPWHFCIWPKGSSRSLDPQIYNKTPDGGPPPAGGHAPASARTEVRR